MSGDNRTLWGFAGDRAHSLREGGTGRRFSIATHEVIRGERVTEWHDVVVFPRRENDWRMRQVAKIAKGSLVIVTGRTTYHKSDKGVRHARILADTIDVFETVRAAHADDERAWTDDGEGEFPPEAEEGDDSEPF